MKTLTYKGYQAEVEYEDGSLFIKVLHINDLLLAECEKASEVEDAFHRLIDDYLETCERLGKEAEKPFKGSFNIRINPGLHRKVAMLAAEEGISLNAWIASALEEKTQ